MEYEEPVWSKLYHHWLAGKNLKQKTKRLQKGKAEMCFQCGHVFFDREPSCDRNTISCFSREAKHKYIEKGNFVILRRGFRGILWVAIYPNSTSLKEGIFDFFKKLARGECDESNKGFRC